MANRDDLRALFDASSVNRFLGLQLERAEAGRAELSLPLRADFVQESGRVQGGIIAALADTAGAYAFLPGLGENEQMATVEFKINFLGSAAPGGAPLRATATALQRGRTIAVCQVDVEQGDRPVATAILTFMFFAAPSG